MKSGTMHELQNLFYHITYIEHNFTFETTKVVNACFNKSS